MAASATAVEGRKGLAGCPAVGRTGSSNAQGERAATTLAPALTGGHSTSSPELAVLFIAFGILLAVVRSGSPRRGGHWVAPLGLPV
jgi:hypothetical protein